MARYEFTKDEARFGGTVSAMRREALGRNPEQVANAHRVANITKWRDLVINSSPELADNPDELDRRARLLHSAHMKRLARLAAKSRRRSAKARAINKARALLEANGYRLVLNDSAGVAVANSA